MTRKSPRELWRTIEDLRDDDPVDYDATSGVTVVMSREQAEAEGREIVGSVEGTTRIVTWETDGEVVGGSPEQRAPDDADLVEVQST